MNSIPGSIGPNVNRNSPSTDSSSVAAGIIVFTVMSSHSDSPYADDQLADGPVTLDPDAHLEKLAVSDGLRRVDRQHDVVSPPQLHVRSCPRDARQSENQDKAEGDHGEGARMPPPALDREGVPFLDAVRAEPAARATSSHASAKQSAGQPGHPISGRQLAGTWSSGSVQVSCTLRGSRPPDSFHGLASPYPNRSPTSCAGRSFAASFGSARSFRPFASSRVSTG